MGHYLSEMQFETETQLERGRRRIYESKKREEIERRIKKLPKEKQNNPFAGLSIVASMNAYVPSYFLESTEKPE